MALPCPSGRLTPSVGRLDVGFSHATGPQVHRYEVQVWSLVGLRATRTKPRFGRLRAGSPLGGSCWGRQCRPASFPRTPSGPRVKEFRINSLTPMTPEAESSPVREWLRSCELHGGSFIDPCGLGTLMPEEETESPEEVRSQRRRSLPNVDE
jgi:hypothetical protein